MIMPIRGIVESRTQKGLISGVSSSSITIMNVISCYHLIVSRMWNWNSGDLASPLCSFLFAPTEK